MNTPISSDLESYQGYWDDRILVIIRTATVMLMAFCLFLYALKYDWI